MLAGTIGVLTLAVLYAVFFLVPPQKGWGTMCASHSSTFHVPGFR